jgi:hypothetical protein
MARTAAPPRPLEAVPRRRIGEAAFLALLVVPLLLLGLAFSRAPAHVERITIRNPAEYRLNVQLASAGEHGEVPLGSVDRDTYLVVEEVPDVGGEWVFHVGYGGFEAAEIRLARGELAAADWTITIPVGAGAALRDAGLQPTPEPAPDNPQRL